MSSVDTLSTISYGLAELRDIPTLTEGTCASALASAVWVTAGTPATLWTLWPRLGFTLVLGAQWWWPCTTVSILGMTLGNGNLPIAIHPTFVDDITARGGMTVASLGWGLAVVVWLCAVGIWVNFFESFQGILGPGQFLLIAVCKLVWNSDACRFLLSLTKLCWIVSQQRTHIFT